MWILEDALHRTACKVLRLYCKRCQVVMMPKCEKMEWYLECAIHNTSPCSSMRTSTEMPRSWMTWILAAKPSARSLPVLLYFSRESMISISCTHQQTDIIVTSAVARKGNSTCQAKHSHHGLEADAWRRKTTSFGVNLMRSQVLYWAAPWGLEG